MRITMVQKLAWAIECADCQLIKHEFSTELKQCQAHRDAVMIGNQIEDSLAGLDPDDCDHEFDPNEGWTCLNCGKEGLEDMAARAYDDAKGRKQDED